MIETSASSRTFRFMFAILILFLLYSFTLPYTKMPLLAFLSKKQKYIFCFYFSYFLFLTNRNRKIKFFTMFWFSCCVTLCSLYKKKIMWLFIIFPFGVSFLFVKTCKCIYTCGTGNVQCDHYIKKTFLSLV